MPKETIRKGNKKVTVAKCGKKHDSKVYDENKKKAGKPEGGK